MMLNGVVLLRLIYSLTNGHQNGGIVKKTKETLERKYYGMKDFTPPLEWIEALHNGKPISCLDVSKYKDDNSNDYYICKKVDFYCQ